MPIILKKCAVIEYRMEYRIRQAIELFYYEMYCCRDMFPDMENVINLLITLNALADKHASEGAFSLYDRQRFYELNVMMNSDLITITNAFSQQYDVCWEKNQCYESREYFWSEMTAIISDPARLYSLYEVVLKIYELHRRLRKEDGALISSSLYPNDVFEEYSDCNATMVDFLRKIYLSDTIASELIPLNPENVSRATVSGHVTPAQTSDASLSQAQHILKNTKPAQHGRQFLEAHSNKMVELRRQMPKLSHAEVAVALNAEFGTNFDAKNCQQHWYRVCKPELRKGRWSVEDDSMLLQLCQQLKSDYKMIAKVMKNRSVAQIRNRALILAKNVPKGSDSVQY